MRRITGNTTISLLALALIAGAFGCKRSPKRVPVEATEETSTTLATMVHVADPRASVQLVKGFYDVEQNAWRWTMQKFSVTLRPPAGSAQKGALLRVQFAIPDPVIEKLKSIRLAANVEGVPLEGQEYTKPGEQVYTAEVPAKALGSEAVVVDFALNKALMPGASDQRELGVVVSTIGFEAK